MVADDLSNLAQGSLALVFWCQAYQSLFLVGSLWACIPRWCIELPALSFQKMQLHEAEAAVALPV